MQVLVKTPLIDVDIKGQMVPNSVVKALQKVYGDKVRVLENDDEFENWFQTDLHKKISARMTLGQIVRIYRENRAWSQVELGKKIGVSAQVISDIEKNRRPMTLQRTKKLADALDVPILRLMKL